MQFWYYLPVRRRKSFELLVQVMNLHLETNHRKLFGSHFAYKQLWDRLKRDSGIWQRLILSHFIPVIVNKSILHIIYFYMSRAILTLMSVREHEF